MISKKIIETRESIYKKFGPLPIQENSYLVLMSPRSGSTLLCAHLQNIKYGNPIEAFHQNQDRIRRLHGWDIDFSNPYAYIQKALEFQTVDGIFGMKFDWAQFEIFLRTARQLTDSTGFSLNDAEVVEVFIPNAKYVHLKRRNKVKQAVSFAKAMQDGIWYVESDSEEENNIPVKYNREHIESCLDILLSFDVAWDNYLHKYNLPVMEFWYEDLAKDYFGKMQEIYAFLGIEGKDIPEPPLKKQANAISQEWVNRFVSETPWLKDRTIAEALEAGDVSTAFIYRMLMVNRKLERENWKKVTASRRFVGIQRLWIRANRKLGRKPVNPKNP